MLFKYLKKYIKINFKTYIYNFLYKYKFLVLTNFKYQNKKIEMLFKIKYNLH